MQDYMKTTRTVWKVLLASIFCSWIFLGQKRQEEKDRILQNHYQNSLTSPFCKANTDKDNLCFETNQSLTAQPALFSPACHTTPTLVSVESCQKNYLVWKQKVTRVSYMNVKQLNSILILLQKLFFHLQSSGLPDYRFFSGLFQVMGLIADMAILF